MLRCDCNPRPTGTDLGKRWRPRARRTLEPPAKTAYWFLGMAPMDANIARERASHPKPTVLSDFILGSQDGIVNLLGIILGLSAATRDVRIILVATLAAFGAEAIAMGAVAYTSTRARRRLYLSQALQERRGVEGKPPTQRGEARRSLPRRRDQGHELEERVERMWPTQTPQLHLLKSFQLQH